MILLIWRRFAFIWSDSVALNQIGQNSTLLWLSSIKGSRWKLKYSVVAIIYFCSSMQYDAIWYKVALYDQKPKKICFSRPWCHLIRNNTIWYDMIWYGTIWYKIMLLGRKPNSYHFKLNSEEFPKNAEHMLLIELVDDDIYLCSLQNWMLIDTPNI